MKIFSKLRNLTLLYVSAAIICGLSSCHKPGPDYPNPPTPPDNHRTDPNPEDNPSNPQASVEFPATSGEIKDAITVTEELAKTLKSIVDDSKNGSSDGKAVAADVAVEAAKLEGVASAKVGDDDRTVIIEQTNKVFVNLLLDTEDFFGEDGSSSYYKIPEMVLNAPFVAKADRTYPKGAKKALLLSPYQSPIPGSNRGGRNVDINTVRGLLDKAGYSLRALIDDEVGLEHFYGDTLAKYDLVLIRTHGGARLVTADGKYTSTALCSGETVDPNRIESFDGNIALTILDGITTYNATSQWLEATTHVQYPGTIVFAGACSSYEDEDLADYFLGHHASAYAGDRRSTAYILNNEYLYGLTRYLTSGYNFADAAARIITDKTTLDVLRRLNSTDPACRADCLRASDSPDVYLFDPYPSNMLFSINKNGEGELSWEMHGSTGEYEYIVDIAGDKITVNNPPMIFNPSKNGTYDWTVTANLFKEGEMLASYESASSFDFGDFPELKPSFDKKSFGDVILGQAPCDTVLLTNSGKSDAVIKSVNCPDGFFVDIKEGDVVGPGTGKKVCIMFEPMAEKSYSGTLAIKYGPGEGRVEIPLSGKGYKKSGFAFSVEPRSLDFGNVYLTKTYKKTLSITNIGDKKGRIQNVVCPDGYSVKYSQTSYLMPGSSMTMEVTLKPTEIKDYSGKIVIESDAVHGDIKVSVKACCVERVSGKLEVSPTSMNFNTVYIGNTKEKEATMTNTGKGVVILESPVYPKGFSTDLKEGTVINPGESVNFKVVFKPSKEGSYRDTMSFPSDADGNAPYINISGIGKATEKGVLDADNSSISFGKVEVGGTGTCSITISNNGKSKVTVSKISCPDGFSAEIGNTTLNAGASTKLTVTFKPTRAKFYSGELSIVSDAQNNPLAISLSGEGTDAATPPSGARLVLSQSSLDFGETLMLERTYQSILISNTGDSPAVIESITSSNSDFSTDFTEETTIKAGASLAVKVEFYPGSEGPSTGKLTIANDTSESPLYVSLSGSAKKAEGAVITWTDDRYNFGDVKVGETAEGLLSIDNSSGVAATISSVSLPEGFTANIQKGAVIKAHSVAFVTVTFSPVQIKQYGGPFTIKSDATNGDQTIALFGNGVSPEPEVVKVSGVTLDKSSLTLYVGQSETLVETVSPENATDKSVVWSSSYSNVASVDSEGMITALAAGSTTITATTNDGSYKAQCSVKVFNVGTLTLSDTEMKMIGMPGQSSIWEFTLTNSSKYSVEVESVSCPQGFSVSNATGTLRSGYYRTVTVSFNPTANKTYSGKILIKTNSSDEPMEIDITGSVFDQSKVSGFPDIDRNNVYGERLYVGVGGMESVGLSMYIDREPGHSDPWEEDAQDWYVTFYCPECFYSSTDYYHYHPGFYSFKVPYNTSKSMDLAFSPKEYCKDYLDRVYLIINGEGQTHYQYLDCFGSSRAYMWCTPKVDFGTCDVNKKWSKTLQIQTEQLYDDDFPSSIKAHILSVSCPEGFSTDLKPGTEIFVENDEWLYTDYKVYFQPTEARDYEGDIIIETDSWQGTLKSHVYGKGD